MKTKQILLNLFYIILIVAFVFSVGALICYKKTFNGHVLPKEPYTIDGINHEPFNLLTTKERKISDNLAKKLKNMYVDLRNVLDSNGIEHWVSGGTLLGVVRHKGFIPWDDDMDIHIKFKDVGRVVNAVGGMKDYKLVNSIIPYILKIFPKDSINNMPPFIDILFENELENGEQGTCDKVLNLFKAGRKCISVKEKETNRKNDIYPLKKMEFEDIWVYVPNNLEKVLEKQYGPNVLTSYIVDPAHSVYTWLEPTMIIEKDVELFGNIYSNVSENYMLL